MVDTVEVLEVRAVDESRESKDSKEPNDSMLPVLLVRDSNSGFNATLAFAAETRGWITQIPRHVSTSFSMALRCVAAEEYMEKAVIGETKKEGSSQLWGLEFGML